MTKPAKYSIRRSYGPRTLAGSVDRLTKGIFARRGFSATAILSEWPRIAGEAIAAYSQPEQITFPGGAKKGGTLHLRVALGGLATELQHREPQLLERINQYFGYRAVERLKLVQGPLPSRDSRPADTNTPLAPEQEAALSENLEMVDDPELREALERLGRNIAKRMPAT